jgi:tRNA (adenine57-N1/adenine58-N1)-methyltransferase
LLRSLNGASQNSYLSQPLCPTQRIKVHHGSVRHDDIVGRRVRDTVTTNKGEPFQVLEPSLNDYVVLTKRIVTPVSYGTRNMLTRFVEFLFLTTPPQIYPAHASVSTSLLDLHVCREAESGPQEKLEVLEAGTGHGALTLHLSRAIHAANTPLPRRAAQQQQHDKQIPAGGTVADEDSLELTRWKATRNAVIHSIDISEKHSLHARGILGNFRHGIYYGNVDFHVGDIAQFLATRPKAFLSHAILDMPSANHRLEVLCPHLRTDAKVLVFNPSVTQIAECIREIDRLGLPLKLDSVIELPAGANGGREWDVRLANIRKSEGGSTSNERSGLVAWLARKLCAVAGIDIPPQDNKHQEKVFVCRPKVVERTGVGGFVGVWRKV